MPEYELPDGFTCLISRCPLLPVVQFMENPPKGEDGGSARRIRQNLADTPEEGLLLSCSLCHRAVIFQGPQVNK